MTTTPLAELVTSEFDDRVDDFCISLNLITQPLGAWFSDVQGFDKVQFASDLMLIVTELAEACEADRKPHSDEHCPTFPNRDIELADVLVRLLHMAYKYNINLGAAFRAKMAYNFTRPPKHGKGY